METIPPVGNHPLRTARISSPSASTRSGITRSAAVAQESALEFRRSRFLKEVPAPRRSASPSTLTARYFERAPTTSAQQDCCRQTRIPSRRAAGSSPIARNARATAAQADIALATPQPFQQRSADLPASRQNNSPAQARKKE